MEYDRGINATLDTSQMDSMYPYILFTKIILLLWDVIGLVVNGLGIDLMWHGIEINHAVYSLVLQDIVLCWLSSLLWCSLNWIWWSTSGIFVHNHLFYGIFTNYIYITNMLIEFFIQVLPFDLKGSRGFEFTFCFPFCH